MFRLLSRVLRRTPLRRSVVLGRAHSWMFGKLDREPVVTVGDFKLELDERDHNIRKKLRLYAEYEAFYQDVLVSLVREGDHVIDVGANVGLHSIPLARQVGTAGHVFAFEPDPSNFSLLSRNLHRNGCTNVTPFPLALSSQSGHALLYQSAHNRGGLSLAEKNVDPERLLPPISVRVERGDEVLRNRTARVSLLKIDVEGAEPLVIQGLGEIISSSPDIAIAFEFSARFIENLGQDPMNCLTALENAGLRLFFVDEDAKRIEPILSTAAIARTAATDRPINLIAIRPHHCRGRVLPR